MANTLFDTILKGINGLTHLEIKTIVGDYTIDEAAKTVEPANNQDMIYSNINLIGGDITTAMGTKFLDDAAYATLREYHESREKEGHAIVERNIEVLKELISLITAVNTEKNKKVNLDAGSAAEEPANDGGNV